MEQVVYARQAFGRSALLLSGGATFGMNHIGVLKALFDAKLLPRIISGASAGSIVCAVLCTRTDEEIPQVLSEFPFGDLAVFEEQDHEDGILERLRRLLTEGAWIDIKHLTRVMHEMLGDMTFQEAYNRTRRILNICVSSASIYETTELRYRSECYDLVGGGGILLSPLCLLGGTITGQEPYYWRKYSLEPDSTTMDRRKRGQ
jgi:TAG lipase/steryl ester hydrolase/phospholipase A2/LPA acyltransferase